MSELYIRIPWHLSKEDKDRYVAIKTKIIQRFHVEREDFLFVKGADQRNNALRGRSRIPQKPKLVPGAPVVLHGFNTVK